MEPAERCESDDPGTHRWRSLHYAFALTAAILTIWVAHWLAPGRLSVARYIMWFVCGAVFYLAHANKKTSKLCINLALVAPLLYAVIHLQPPHYYWPIITAIASGAILSRIERWHVGRVDNLDG